MARNKPLKRHKALVELSRDHHVVLLLCWKLRQGFARGVSGTRMAAYLQHFFKEHLQDHCHLEEALIFPSLPETNLLRQKAERQHQELYGLMAQVSEREEIHLIQELEEKLEKHIRFEERELFMDIQASLTEAQLLRLEEKVNASHSPMKEKWEDRFWE